MENAYKETKFILNKYHIIASKSLGQNFLIGDKIIEKTVDAACISNEDLIIEIGPGLGTLTSKLLERAKKVIAIELDKKMIEILNERFSLYTNLEILNENLLKVNLKKLIEKEKQENQIKEVKIVANLPYYITTPIIMKLLEDKIDISSITVMVQKEVAERLTANPGEKLAGAITYAVAYYSEVESIVEVSRECFIPEPTVESEVIKLTLRKTPPVLVQSEEKFFKLIKASFSQRRKTFLNGISNSRTNRKKRIKKYIKTIRHRRKHTR